MTLPEPIQSFWTLILAHPGAFAALGLLALALGIGIGLAAGRTIGGRRIRHLSALLDQRGKDYSKLNARAIAFARLAKDPDGLRQNGETVGKARAFVTKPEEGVLVFDRIEGNGDFKPTETFVFRGKSYRIDSVEQLAAGQMNGVRTQVYGKVTARPVT